MDDKTIRKLAKAIADELRCKPLVVTTAAELEVQREADEERRQRLLMGSAAERERIGLADLTRQATS